jgi:hypothetical protein
MHIILRDKKYFKYLILNKASVNTISGSSNLIEGSRRANIILPKRTKFCTDDALYSSKSRRNLINFLRIFVLMVIMLKPLTKAVTKVFILQQPTLIMNFGYNLSFWNKLDGLIWYLQNFWTRILCSSFFSHFNSIFLMLDIAY